MGKSLLEDLVNLSTPSTDEAGASATRRLEDGIRRVTLILDDLNRELNLDTLLERTMDAAVKLTEAERGFLVLVDESGQLDFRVASNDASRNIPDAQRAASHTIIRKVLDGGEPILVNDIGDQADLKAQRSLAELHIRSVMGAPLRAGGRLLGAAYVDTARAEAIFTPEDLLLFQSFVHLAAIALENARLLEAERQARRRVQSLQAELTNTLESLPLGIILINSHTQIQYLNRTAQLILKKAHLEVGDNLLSRGTAECPWLLRIFNALGEWLQGHRSEEWELRLDERILNYSFFEVVRDGAVITQIGVLLDDVTENRALQRKLIESEKWSTVNQLAGGIAHEIKNSLQPICSGTEILQMTMEMKGALGPPLQRQIETIQNAAARIQHIVEDLNRLTKPASPNFAPVDLTTVAQSAVDLMEITTGKLKDFVREEKDPNARLQFRVELPDDLPLIHGNGSAIEGAIINLLLNAADAVREKGHGRIVLKAGTTDRGWVTVTIEDTGTGIAPEYLKRVFEPYFTTKTHSGTGLGLSIVRNTMEVHGGKIETDSKLGEGTRITLSFPTLASSRSAMERFSSESL
ncbi:MAG: ATP-binding protein [bacterium]